MINRLHSTPKEARNLQSMVIKVGAPFFCVKGMLLLLPHVFGVFLRSSEFFFTKIARSSDSGPMPDQVVRNDGFCRV